MTNIFEHATEGIRALIFYDGRLEAGLGTALRILTGALVLGGAISLARDAIARGQGARKEGSSWGEAVAAEGMAWKGGFGSVQ